MNKKIFKLNKKLYKNYNRFFHFNKTCAKFFFLVNQSFKLYILNNENK